MSRKDNPYYGSDEVYGEADWQFVRWDITLPNAPHTFWNQTIQYHQPTISNSSCSIHACAGALSDLTGYKFSTDEMWYFWTEAKKDGASEYQWRWIYKAVDLIRHYWNDTHPLEKVSSFQAPTGSSEYRDALDKWYSLVLWYRWNRLYNNDVDDNCILEWYEFGEWTYGHAIRKFKKKTSDGGNYSTGIYGWDNYEATKKCNIYKITRDGSLIDNNVFFSSAYFYSFIDGPMSNIILPRHIQPSSGSKREIILAWERIMTKYMEDWGQAMFKNYLDDYAITRMLIEIHDLRKQGYDG